jgi:hypothetical protein
LPGAWAALVAGAHPADVARHSLRQALAATVLGDLDAALLDRLGHAGGGGTRIARATVAEAAGPVDPALQDWAAEGPERLPAMRCRASSGSSRRSRGPGDRPGARSADPRSAESHAEHCALVALFGVVLAPVWGARPETVFLAGLAHHCTMR